MKLLCQPAYMCCGVDQRSHVNHWQAGEAPGANGALDQQSTASNSSTEHANAAPDSLARMHPQSSLYGCCVLLVLVEGKFLPDQ
jgi:hypothetical protein